MVGDTCSGSDQHNINSAEEVSNGEVIKVEVKIEQLC